MLSVFLKQHGDYSSERCFSQLTTLKMGGRIAHFVAPYNKEDLLCILEYLHNENIEYKIIGNGSNLICGSSFYDGVVISLMNLNSYRLDGDILTADAGVRVPYLAQIMARNGMSGLEFASGIPGTVGGLVFMNAGAYKGEIADILIDADILKDGNIVTMTNKEMDFSYRYSIIRSHPDWTILSCRFKMTKGVAQEIIALMDERFGRRKSSQPLEYPSAGSTFRNPESLAAWKLIDGIGYRGIRHNGIQVSQKHSNFLINTGSGTAEDYLALVEEIQNKVYETYGIELHMEAERFHCE